MKNRLLSPTNAMATITILAGLLGVTKESIAQNLAQNEKIKADIENTKGVTNNADSLAYTDPLAFTLQNIQNYFPDQESVNQANFLINRLGKGTIRDQVNQLIIQYIITNISDPKQQIWTIMYSLEDDVFGGDKEVKAIFSNKYEVEDPINFEVSRKFEKAFKLRITNNSNQMLKDIEQLNQKIEQGNKRIEQGNIELEQNRLEIEKTMNFITPDMVKSDPNIKNIITKRSQRYERLKQKPTNPHIIELFQALEQ